MRCEGLRRGRGKRKRGREVKGRAWEMKKRDGERDWGLSHPHLSVSPLLSPLIPCVEVYPPRRPPEHLTEAGADGYYGAALQTAARVSCRREDTAAAPPATRTNPTSMMKEALEPSSCTSPVVYADCPESVDIQEAEEPVERMEPEGRPVWMSPVLR